MPVNKTVAKILVFSVTPLLANPVIARENDGFIFKALKLNTFRSIDSDTIETRGVNLSSSGAINKVVLNWGVKALDMNAEKNSGLRAENITGRKVNYFHPWIGLRLPVNKMLHVDLNVGYETTNVDVEKMTWKAALDGSFSDALYVKIFTDHSLYAVSPLAISRNVDQTLYGIEASWTPLEKLNIEGSVDFADYSDDNTRWGVMLAPSWKIAKNETFDFALGAQGTYFKFDEDLGNGYYDPQEAQKYLLTSKVKIQEPGYGNIGIEVAAGRRKDDRIAEFDYALQFNAYGSFTLHPGVLLDLRASALKEGGGAFLPYWWHEFALNVTANF